MLTFHPYEVDVVWMIVASLFDVLCVFDELVMGHVRLMMRMITSPAQYTDIGQVGMSRWALKRCFSVLSCSMNFHNITSGSNPK